MALFLHCLTFTHERFWVFRPESILKFKYINKSPFINKPSVFYLSILIHQHYIGSQEGSGEMAHFLIRPILDPKFPLMVNVKQ